VADLSLKYLLFGEDRTASKSLKGVGAQAGATSNLVGKSVSKIGSMVGGEVGDMISRVSSAFEDVGGKAKGLGPKLAVGGTAMLGLGVAMQQMASGDVESMKQLNAAVEATGKGYDSFGSDVEKLIEKQVAFGNTDDQVTTALRVLTQAYGDPKKAMAEMAVTTDLAAAKHISLAAAAGLVAKVHGGAGRTLKEFGLNLADMTNTTKNLAGAEKAVTTSTDTLTKAQDGAAKAAKDVRDAQQKLADLQQIQHGKAKLTIQDHIAMRDAQQKLKDAIGEQKDALDFVAQAQGKVKTTTAALTTATAANAKGVTQGDEALTKLAGKLKGQASASMDNFGGKVKIATTWLTNQASTLSAKYGPAVTMAGVVITALGTVMQILATRQAAAAVATDTATVAVARQTLGSKIAAAAQWLWNAALDANPIGLVVVAVAALVGAIILIATKTTWFQTVWQYMTSSLAAAWRWLWNSVLAPIIRFVLNGFATITDGIANMLRVLSNIPGFGWAKTAADKMSGAAAQARAIAKGIKDIPPSKTIMVKTLGYAATYQQLMKIQSTIRGINNMPVRIATGAGGQGGQVVGHARGTSNFAGGMTWVGEEGPELVSLPRGSAIYSHQNSMAMAGGGGSAAGGSSQPLVVQLVLDSRVVHQSLLALKRTNGGGLALG